MGFSPAFGNQELFELQQLNEKVDQMGHLVAEMVNLLREIRDELQKPKKKGGAVW